MTQAAMPSPGQPPRTDPLATWALVMGILNFVCCIPFVPAVLAIVLGGRSKEKIRASGGTLGGESLAQTAVILGWIGIGLDVLICIVGAILGILLCVLQDAGQIDI